VSHGSSPLGLDRGFARCVEGRKHRRDVSSRKVFAGLANDHKGQRVSPVDLYEKARKSLHFVGYQGLSIIAVPGLDMAAWDALAKAAGVPLCVLLGGSVGPVNAYNSNGLWLQSLNPRHPRRSNCSTRGAEDSER
jgi:L-alanine-DL-glutamate epimerase-like enolase superfamily enzyme